MKINKLTILLPIVFYSVTLFAAEPIFTATRLSSVTPVILQNQKVNIRYLLTNNTPRTFTGVGITQMPAGMRQQVVEADDCDLLFNLGSHQNCVLNLEVDEALMSGNIQGGPTVCYSKARPVFCSMVDPQLILNKNAEISAIMNKPRYQNAIWGLRVLDSAKKQLIIDLKPDYQFFIASVRKIFTVGEFLNQVGPDDAPVTTIHRDGEIINGQLSGNIVLLAAGDLTMGGRTLPNGKIDLTIYDHNEADALGNAILTSPNPLAGYIDLAKQVYASGVREITGDVIIDDRLFEPFTFRNEFKVSPIFVNDNTIDVIINPTKVSALASVNWQPKSAAFNLNNTLMTSAIGTPSTIKISPYFPSYIGKSQISGELPIDFVPPLTKSFPLVQTFRILKPADYARTVFLEAMQAQGISIKNAPITAPNPVHKLLPSGSYNSSNQLAQLVSLPYSEYAKYILKVSYNIGADTSLVLFGLTQGVKSLAASLSMEQANLAAHYGITAESYHFIDGSGGGDTTALTTTVTQFLDEMRLSPYFDTYQDAFPVMGIDGSVGFVNDFVIDPNLKGALGNIFTKPGTYVVADPKDGLLIKGLDFAGYINSRLGKKITYHVVVNNVHINSVEDLLSVFQDLGTISAIVWKDY